MKPALVPRGRPDSAAHLFVACARYDSWDEDGGGSQFQGWTTDSLFLLGVQIHVKGFLFVSCLAFALLIMSCVYIQRYMLARPSSMDQDQDHDFSIREPPKPARRTACSRRRPAFPLSTIGQLFIPASMSPCPSGCCSACRCSFCHPLEPNKSASVHVLRLCHGYPLVNRRSSR